MFGAHAKAWSTDKKRNALSDHMLALKASFANMLKAAEAMERAEKASSTTVGIEELLSVCVDQFCDQYNQNDSIHPTFEPAFS